MSEKLKTATEFRDFRDKSDLSLKDHLDIEGALPLGLIDSFAIELFMHHKNARVGNEFGKQMTLWNRQLHVLLDQRLQKEGIS